MRLFPIAVLLALFAVPVFGAGEDTDDDGDGWTENQGDCCDVVASCPQPALVNPGAFEVPGNGVDDNCNGTIDEPREVCDAGLASNDSDPLSYAKAMDLCEGVISAQFVLPDGTGTPSSLSRAIRALHGAVVPQFATSFLVLSTGRAAAPGQTNPAFAEFEPGTPLGTTSALPADWLAANGNRVPVPSGCPEIFTGTASDGIMLQLQVRVPTNARSFRVATRFLTSEYPEWVCSNYVDPFVILLDSAFAGSPANPHDKNVAAHIKSDGQIVVTSTSLVAANTSLFRSCKNGSTGCSGMSPGTYSQCTGTSDLAGTGFDGLSAEGSCGENNLVGGGTGWLSTTGNVVPGETIELRFAIWDTADGFNDSLVLIDGFTWEVDNGTPGTVIAGDRKEGPLSDSLGLYLILRTSPLTPLREFCCPCH